SRGAPRRESSELLTFVDHSVEAGDSVGYRLVSPAGVAMPGSEVWASVPGWSALALVSRYGNPSRGGLRFTASFPGPGPADLAVFDVTGRRMRSVKLTVGKPGGIIVDAEDGHELPPGVYLARLTYAGSSVRERIVLL